MAPQWVDPYPGYSLALQFSDVGNEYNWWHLTTTTIDDLLTSSTNTDGLCLTNNYKELQKYEFLFYNNPYLIGAFKIPPVNVPTSAMSMFGGCTSLIYLDVNLLSAAIITDMTLMLANCKLLSSIELSVKCVDEISLHSICLWCESLRNFQLRGEIIAKNCANMFSGCKSLESIELSNLRIRNCKYVTNMFYGCSSLKDLHIPLFGIPDNDAEIDHMFNGCNRLIHIECKSKFRDWAIANAVAIELPTAFRNASYSGWEIVD